MSGTNQEAYLAGILYKCDMYVLPQCFLRGGIGTCFVLCFDVVGAVVAGLRSAQHFLSTQEATLFKRLWIALKTSRALPFRRRFNSSVMAHLCYASIPRARCNPNWSQATLHRFSPRMISHRSWYTVSLSSVLYPPTLAPSLLSLRVCVTVLPSDLSVTELPFSRHLLVLQCLTTHVLRTSIK